jgi:kynurenine formamidase
LINGRGLATGGAMLGAVLVVAVAVVPQEGSAPRGWTKGKGWGWVYGAGDERGSLNGLTDASRRDAMGLVKKGEVFDLGLTYSRRSYRFAGHNPGEVISFRSPEGLDREKDADAPAAAINPDRVYWHSNALFISDNVATQIDGLAHITSGADHHWYNGFKEADWGRDFGVRKCDAVSIPPIIARGVLVDVAGFRGVEALAGHTAISAKDLQDALAWEGVRILPGDVVLVRTGAARYWGEDGADHAKIAEHDTAGVTLEGTRWLVEDQGAVLVGSDTSGYEHAPLPGEGTAIPVHKYLLVDQGVHIGEFHDLEALSRERVYQFCYIALVNKVRGAVAGFAMRPIAVR